MVSQSTQRTVPPLASPLWFVALAGVVLYAALFLYNLRQSWQRELDAEIARIRAAGEPITVEDLYDFYTPSDEALAAGEEWLAACAFMETAEFERAAEGVPFVGDSQRSIIDKVYLWERGGPLPAVEKTRDFLARYEQHIDQIVAVVEANDRIAFRLNWHDSFVGDVRRNKLWRQFSRLLKLRAAVAMKDRDGEAAARAVMVVLSFAESVGDEPTLTAQLIGMAIEGDAWRTLSRALAHDDVPENRLGELQQLLSTRNRLPGVRGSLVADRAVSFSALRNPTARLEVMQATVRGGEFSWWDWTIREPIWQFYDPKNARTHLIFTSQVISDIEEGPAIALKKVDDAEKRYRGKVEQGAFQSHVWEPPWTLKSVAHPYLKNAYTFAAGIRVAAAGCAVARWRLAEGGWPDSLEQAAKRFGPLEVSDLFSDGPLRFRVHDGGCVVYSVGPDGVDDGEPVMPDGWFNDDVVFIVGRRPYFDAEDRKPDQE